MRWQAKDIVNYRHRFHAGNFADVMKHALLVGLVRALQRKQAAALLADTHAGRGGYDLGEGAAGDRLPRRPEHPGGIGRIARLEGAPHPVVEYIELVREYDRGAGRPPAAGPASIRHYPGSPWLLRRLARPQDRLAFCELHPEEFAALRAALGRVRRTALLETDGYAALRGLLPPPERRGLALIDPPFEDRDEPERMAAAMRDALRRFPTGVYALWHPLSPRIELEPLWEELRAQAGRPVWRGRLTVDPQAEGMRGCGLVVVNPPWKFAPEADAILEWLAQRLGAPGPAEAGSDWLEPSPTQAAGP